jgi:BASS family bile acid:Na+ symporter
MLAVSIFLGVMFPALATLFKPLLFPTIFLLFFFAVLQVRLSDAVEAAISERACAIILIWQLVVLPLAASVLLKPLLDDHWYLFSVVALCTSSITATTAFAKIFDLDAAMALSVCILGTLLMPLPLYLVVNLVGGVEVAINFSTYVSRIVIFILLPFLLVWLVRSRASVALNHELSRLSPAIVLCLLMIFGLCVMDGVRDMIHEEPVHLILLVVMAFALSLSVQLATYLGLRFLGARLAKTACLLCAYRNMGIVAAITGTSLGEYFLIFVGVWQLPMYLLPLLLKRLYQHREV